MRFNDERGQTRWPGGGGDWEELRSRVPRFSRTLVLAAVVVVLLIWLGTGLYKVGPGEQGVVRRFGKVVDKTGAGLNYHY
ncbi:MAG: hypothetical protein ACE5K9_11030, partial [Candidatus Methylomirabilales bacterium]